MQINLKSNFKATFRLSVSHSAPLQCTANCVCKLQQPIDASEMEPACSHINGARIMLKSSSPKIVLFTLSHVSHSSLQRGNRGQYRLWCTKSYLTSSCILTIKGLRYKFLLIPSAKKWFLDLKASGGISYDFHLLTKRNWSVFRTWKFSHVYVGLLSVSPTAIHQ